MGRTFRLDPVAVLAETDPFLWAVRVAAYRVVQRDEKAAADQASKP